MTKRCFPDVNVWFALAVEDHPHHPAAASWWSGEGNTIVMSRLVQICLLRLLTTAAAMDGAPLSNRKAWKLLDTLLEDSRVSLFPEPPGAEERFRHWSSGKESSPKVWADAYIAAFANAAGAAVVTFDRAFARWNVEIRVPDEPAFPN